MLDLFTVLKDLVSKMLNPNRPLRLKIHQVEKHQWIQGVLVEEFEPITAEWQEETLQKIAKTSTVEVDDVVDELGKNPYGKLGGFYNIEKRLHQLKTMALKKAPSCSNFRIAEVINHINSIYPSQISTFCLADYKLSQD